MLKPYLTSAFNSSRRPPSHQRPPSVGMPRHAFRRRMTNTHKYTRGPRLGGPGRLPASTRRVGEGPVAAPLFKIYHKEFAGKKHDFENHP